MALRECWGCVCGLGYTQGCWHIPYLCSKMHFVPICASLEHRQCCCCCHLLWHRGLVAQSPAASKAQGSLHCLLCTHSAQDTQVWREFYSIQQQKPYTRWINLLMCPSPQNESSIKQFYYIVANTSSVSVIHIKKLHLIIKHTICTGHLRETG